MITSKIWVKYSLRPWMKPLLVVGALLNWKWLVASCFKKEIVSEGDEVNFHG